MKNKLFKTVGIYLVVMSIITATSNYFHFLFSFTMVIFLLDKISSVAHFFMVAILLLAGMHHSYIGFKNEKVSKVALVSARMYFASLIATILAVLLSWLPCIGSGDGLCMILGIPFMFLSILFLFIGTVATVVGLFFKG
jgi:hypothetical protein